MSRLNQFLQGIKVVDLSRHLPGPLASLMLADMGADVIKVEPPHGEELRSIGPADESGQSVWFDAINAGKRGVRLNLKEQADQQKLLSLLKDADILLESFRPGVLDKLGLTVDVLEREAPQLIVCSLNGYGTKTPLVNEVGHDLNYLAMNGVLDGTGTEEQAVAPWPPLADCSAGLFGLSTVLGALVERQRTGKGCRVEVALADSVMPLMTFNLAELQLQEQGELEKAMPRAQALLNGGAANYRTYTTKDGHQVAMGGVEPKFWRNFCVAAGKEEWVERMADPFPQRDLQAEVAAFIGERTLDECNALFADVECCYNQVLNISEAVQTPHIQARELVVKNQQGQYQALYPAYVDDEAPQQRKAFEDIDIDSIL